MVKTASDKMSVAPELSPGDWKWIECISLYIDNQWHGGNGDRNGGETQRRGDLEWVDECDGDEEKEHWEERKRAVVCYQLTAGAFQPLHCKITETEGPAFMQPLSILVQSQARWLLCWVSHHLAALSTPGNGHNWRSQTNSWMKRVKGHWFPRG